MNNIKSLKMKLSTREKNVIEGVVKGYSNKEIGKVMHIKDVTVKFHLTRIFKKLGFKNRSQLAIHFATKMYPSCVKVKWD